MIFQVLPLLSKIHKHNNTSNDIEVNSLKKKIHELEKQITFLQTELEDAKHFSDTLAGVISDDNTWESTKEVNNFLIFIEQFFIKIPNNIIWLYMVWQIGYMVCRGDA